MPPHLDSVPHCLDIDGHGDFHSDSYMDAIRAKMDLILDSIQENLDSVIVWSDVDIVFVRNPVPVIQEIFDIDGSLDILFQRENTHSHEVNAGFLAMRCSDILTAFYKLIAFELGRNRHADEQMVINHVLNGNCSVKWSLLPTSFYAKTHGWPPPDDLIIYHANYTHAPESVHKKIDQLNHFFDHQRNIL
jgi:hypothetical protein